MKTICIILGTISLGLGILGIFLPLLPTTPFLLLTAALYFKGSPRLYQWLLNHKYFGTYIRNFRENKAIPLLVKTHSYENKGYRQIHRHQNHLTAAHVGHNALLHFLPDPVGLGQDTPLPDSRRRNLSYTFF